MINRIFAAFALLMAAAGAALAAPGSPTYATVNLGIAGYYNGSLAFSNTTSGSITLAPPTGALGSVTLTLPDSTGTLALLASPALTGTPTAPTPSSGDTSTQISNDAWVSTYFGSLAGTQSWAGANTISGSIKLNLKWETDTAPTIASGFGTSPSIQFQDGTAAFSITVGTGGTASSGVVTMPSATHDWACQATDNTSHSTTISSQYVQATSGTSITITNYSDVAVASAWNAGDLIYVECAGI